MISNSRLQITLLSFLFKKFNTTSNSTKAHPQDDELTYLLTYSMGVNTLASDARYNKFRFSTYMYLIL